MLIFQNLKNLETALNGATEPVRQLALELLKRFQCDWTQETLVSQAITINQEMQLMPDEIIEQAFTRPTGLY
jgi:hypothetical protein